MPVTYEFNDGGKVIAHRDAASGRLLWSLAGGFAPQQRIETRHDAADVAGGHPAGGAAPIRSAAALRRALGEPERLVPRRVVVNPVQPLPQVRYDAPAAVAALPGAIKSSAEFRAALGERPRLAPRGRVQNPPVEQMRQDAALADPGFGPMRSANELRRRLGLSAR